MAKIMLIEDAPDTQELIKSVLEMSGHTVITAETGEEGLAQTKNLKPDVVLIDISLPGKMNGLDVTRRLRGEPDFAATPILALTAHAMAEDARQSLAAGCDAHITKPIFDLEKFSEKVSRYAAEGRK